MDSLECCLTMERRHLQTRGQHIDSLCLRRLITLAIFLLPWAICNAAPWQLSDYKKGHWTNDTQTGTVSRKRQYNSYHVEGSTRGCKREHSTNSRRHHRHHNRHKSKDNEVFPAVRSSNILNEIPTYVSDLVAFSPVKPVKPPWSPEAVLSADMNEVTGRHHREKRSTTGRGEPYQAACERDASWVEKSWAYDLFGNNVTVVNEITTSDGKQMKQWFYQTTCKRTPELARAPSPCAGIDAQVYESECEEKLSFVYAVVRTPKGEQGWNWVTISTSCNCAFRQRASPMRRTPLTAYSSSDSRTQPTLSRER
ncbi:neurotrophin-3-like isoform X1 [Asterias rubens]|uniref:neurotrophin-3-like isoform X1 n=1 Tax=Asterias rubens TaxID=7604 RepID=UPI0014553EEF|nr:neurotrophin-3-like isoform X1 [Asterias rubens]